MVMTSNVVFKSCVRYIYGIPSNVPVLYFRIQNFCKSSPFANFDYKNEMRTKFGDYDVERLKYQTYQQPEYFNFATDVFDWWTHAYENGKKQSNLALWLVTSNNDCRKLTFSGLTQLSKKGANVLKELGNLHKGDNAIVILPRVYEWWVIFLAAIRSGVVLIPGTCLLTPKDIEYRITSSQTKCVICSEDLCDKVDEAVEGVHNSITKIAVGSQNTQSNGWLSFNDAMIDASDTFPDVRTRSTEPMLTYFTSGTTGLPKMTQHSHSSYTLGHLITARYSLNCYDGDVVYNVSDLGWAKAAYSSIFAPWMAGATVFQHDTQKFDVDTTLQILASYPITHFCAPPTAYRQFITKDLTQYTFPTLQHCVSAGESLNAEILETWKNSTGLQIYEFYGQTETTVLCGNRPGIPIKPGSMGKVSPGYDVQIVDSKGEVLDRGEEGEIAVRYRPTRPIGLFTGYVNDEERTKSAFVGDYYLTGDRAVMDEDGYIWFVGRSDDIIMSAGYRIGPFEIESALLEHPAVQESAVVSSPDKIRHEVVKAFVVLHNGFENVPKDELKTELQEHVKRVTAPYKYPRKIEFVAELPKTISGKIRRVELRNREWSLEPSLTQHQREN